MALSMGRLESLHNPPRRGGVCVTKEGVSRRRYKGSVADLGCESPGVPPRVQKCLSARKTRDAEDVAKRLECSGLPELLSEGFCDRVWTKGQKAEASFTHSIRSREGSYTETSSPLPPSSTSGRGGAFLCVGGHLAEAKVLMRCAPLIMVARKSVAAILWPSMTRRDFLRSLAISAGAVGAASLPGARADSFFFFGPT